MKVYRLKAFGTGLSVCVANMQRIWSSMATHLLRGLSTASPSKLELGECLEGSDLNVYLDNFGENFNLCSNFLLKSFATGILYRDGARGKGGIGMFSSLLVGTHGHNPKRGKPSRPSPSSSTWWVDNPWRAQIGGPPISLPPPHWGLAYSSTAPPFLLKAIFS